MSLEFATRLDAFFAYLLEKQVATEEQLQESKQYFRAAGDIRIGQVAVLLGLIRPRDVVRIVAEQILSSSLFGEAAVKLGLMKSEQVDLALRGQKDRCVQAIEVLRIVQHQLGASPLTDDDARRALIGFEQWLKNVVVLEEAQKAAEEAARKREGDKVRIALKRIRQLATLPTVVQRVLVMLDDPATNLESIAKVLEGDPPIAAQVMRLANSALFAARHKATTLLRGLVVLGMSNVRQVVTSAGIMAQFAAGKEPEMREHWYRSILGAQWARALAQRQASRVPPEEAFIGALMADLGQLVIRQHFPKPWSEIKALMASQELSMEVAERKLMGISHAEVGAFLAHTWNFPPALEEAILYHHAPWSSLRKLELHESTKVVNAAIRLAELTADHRDASGLAKLDASFFETHEISRDTPLAMAPEVFAETDQLVRALLI